MRRACRSPFWLFGALVVLLIVGTVWLQLASERAAILDEARKHTSNLARAFEEHIRRTVKEVDQTLLVLKRGYESDPAHFALWEWPGKELLLQDLPVQIAMADRDGRAWSARPKVPRRSPCRCATKIISSTTSDHADNSLFSASRSPGAAPGTGRCRCRAVSNTPDGSFAGVLVVSLDPYLSGAVLRDRRSRARRHGDAGRARRHRAGARLVRPQHAGRALQAAHHDRRDA